MPSTWFTFGVLAVSGLFTSMYVITPTPSNGRRTSVRHALTALRDQFRCKEIWVSGAARYRSPDEDVPPDSEQRRDDYQRDTSE